MFSAATAFWRDRSAEFAELTEDMNAPNTGSGSPWLPLDKEPLTILLLAVAHIFRVAPLPAVNEIHPGEAKKVAMRPN
ncbi:hypothetical protein [Aureimonas phyllosphaerae]|uniref:Uncharacterized protein n=1 Tax=Aureimonas phyllosphaerae TaxID=1166078 RepID=A0A7W6BUD4_9HYPH|nr:hypothetical protein [Aureimonas phyllosphaerae]MBB3938198.1 hypothetical protein [Aureimonas phyllosphaerae]MBB3962219.1 hypothetical protein [Aureimonas phyllosphaerae]